MKEIIKIVNDYVAVWNEADAAQRRRRIRSVWLPDGTTCFRVLDAMATMRSNSASGFLSLPVRLLPAPRAANSASFL